MSERPVECGGCKKPIKVIYKEIVSGNITITEMCVDCPVLLKKLHGESPGEIPQEMAGTETGLFCGKCHTSLEAVKMGNPLGCSECYTIFSDVIVADLIERNKLPKRLQKVRRGQPLHVGKTPDEPVISIPESSRLTSLNEALNEALKKENYEEAAWLRDQIKELMDKKDEPKS